MEDVMSGKIYRVIGLMSGTSADGVDAAYIETDGHGYVEAGGSLTLPYPPEFRRALLGVMGKPDDPALPGIEMQLTDFHARTVDILLRQINKTTADIDIVAFHGQTIFHDPAQRKTLQIGDGTRLAAATKIDVINDYRTADVAAGGQGAPLVPLYHAAIAHTWPKPCAIVNIGGVANVTYLGTKSEIIACDTGPGCALIDDAMQLLFGLTHDELGAIARTGTANEKLLGAWLADEYFDMPAPKSLDRNHFKHTIDVADLPSDEAIATLTEFTARSIAVVRAHLPEAPLLWLVTGGGRKNYTLMRRLADAVAASVRDISEMGWDGDALEAQAFGYLAVRSRLGLPLSLPTTTGVPTPMTGGRFYAALRRI
jgi:anhydro-N-acetylmuramic acid kinase